VIAALPVVPSAGCSLPGLNELCGSTANLGTSILSAGAGDVLGAIAAGVAQGASWLLGQIGGVITTTTSIDLGAAWFRDHYGVMVALSAVVLLPLLLASVIQAIFHQSVSSLLRTVLVHLPVALLLGAVAVQLVQLALAATDAMSAAVASGSSGSIGGALSGLASSLANQAATGGAGVPVFVTLLGALFVSLGALLLWVELLVRSAAVYVATLFLPLALASLVWPAISGWCRRLVETVVALVLSKFVIVSVLGLAVGALGTGDGSISAELAGGALLLLAAFAPFTLLRLVPMVESHAAQQLEGARHRVQHAALSGPRSAVAFAMARRGPEPLPELPVGTGLASLVEVPGAAASGTPAEGRPEPLEDSVRFGVPMWRGSAQPPLADRPAATDTSGVADAPPPLWGAPVGRPEPARRPAGAHVVGRDGLGPVITWHPESSSPSGEGPDGR
jgi:hypothetical protein